MTAPSTIPASRTTDFAWGEGHAFRGRTLTLRCRLHEGRWNKARRGALIRSLPVGYVCGEEGTIRKDPDRQVQARIAYVFRLCARLRAAHKVLVQLRVRVSNSPPSVGWPPPWPRGVESTNSVGHCANAP